MKILLAVVLLAALLGCAPATRVTLLPLPSKQPSSVEVKTTNESWAMTAPFEVANVTARGAISADRTTAADVQQRHAALLAVQPAPPERFILYFSAGGSALTPESEGALSGILAQAVARPGGEILIVGHTDTVGTLEVNDRLSKQRAAVIREQVIARGFPPLLVHAVGRGKRELALPTEDGVNEPRNRRVEIVVR
ncbi:MAG: OmpA family protein [Comamonadaceae bacterium]|nr:OmpA family protein [Comamonadaceae bacterium]